MGLSTIYCVIFQIYNLYTTYNLKTFAGEKQAGRVREQFWKVDSKVIF